MGHPKKLRKKWKRPRKLFDKDRIRFEKELKREYGFRRKKEIWKLEYDFKNIKRQARKILATKDKEAEKILIEKMDKMNILPKNSDLEDVLSLELKSLCDRRLQTILQKKGIANTVNHARQLITHKKVIVGNRIINQPNYLVSKEEEKNIKLKEKIKKEKPEKKEEVKEEKPENGKVKEEPKQEEKSGKEQKTEEKVKEEKPKEPEKIGEKPAEESKKEKSEETKEKNADKQ